MHEMSFKSRTGNEVVNVYVGKENTMEDLIHESLKHLSSVPLGKRKAFVRTRRGQVNGVVTVVLLTSSGDLWARRVVVL